MIKILLIGMVKNESKIIKRCLSSALPIIDAICVLDTGSTDNTKEIINEFMLEHQLPGKIFEDTFVDFGYSRSKSFTFAKQFLKEELKWDEINTYGLLLDADHILKTSLEFDKNTMLGNYDHYTISQTDSTTYYNICLIRMSEKWICVGKTHEFWTVDKASVQHTGAIVENKEMIWIDDRSDGGCKSDKYERDVKLLLKGVEECEMDENPSLKLRYCFYLGQSYFSLKNYEKSIEYYQKRIDGGGWPEETWVAMVAVLRCYVELNKKESSYLPKIESWALRSYDFRNSRSESLYILAEELIRLKRFEQAEKYIEMGMNIPKPDKELLFLDEGLYLHGFLFLQVKLKDERGDQDAFLEHVKFMNRVNSKYHNQCLIEIIKHTKQITLKHFPGFYISENPKTLSISFDAIKNNYRLIINDKLIRFDSSLQQISFAEDITNKENLTGINLSGICFFSQEGYFGIFEELQYNIIGKKENNNVLLNEKTMIQSIYPWKLNNIVKESYEFFKYFNINVPAHTYNNNYMLLLTANIETENAKVTLLLLLKCDKNGKLLSISFPFCLDKIQPAGVCSFTLHENKITIIYFTICENKFVPRLAQFDLGQIQFYSF